MKDAENMMSKNYRVALQYVPDGYWIAEHPELPGCKADGETAQEALSSLDVSRELWIESRLATGLEVPEPQEAPQYSGRFVLRIPKSLHRDLANEAEAEGVSLNSLVSNVLASRHTRKEQSVSFVPQFAYPYMGGVYSAFCAPEKVSTPLSNVLSMPGRQQSHWPNQKMQSEIEQAPEKERQYA
jgi:predicted RNase H-like HicB family nuclease